MCKIATATTNVNFIVSIFFLTLMAVDRYIAIKGKYNPIVSRKRPIVTHSISLCIWLIGILIWKRLSKIFCKISNFILISFFKALEACPKSLAQNYSQWLESAGKIGERLTRWKLRNLRKVSGPIGKVIFLKCIHSNWFHPVAAWKIIFWATNFWTCRVNLSITPRTSLDLYRWTLTAVTSGGKGSRR